MRLSLTPREEKLLKEFGLELIKPEYFPAPHKFVRRGIFIAVRGLEEFIKMMRSGEFYILTGIMPSYKLIHLGTYAVVESVKYFQSLSRVTIIAIADIESLATRSISLDVAREYAEQYHIPTYLALGLNPDKTFFYYQSENPDILKIAGDVSGETTLNEMRAIYGDVDPSRIVSSLIQVGDILFPQFYKPMNGLVPIGLDQDPHMRLCRDYVRRTRHFFFDQVSSIYIRLIPGLDGSEKMSKSDPENSIFLPTVEEHRRRGGNLDIDVPFRILTYILDDDKLLQEIAEKYRSGEMLSGELKKIAFEVLWDFMKDFKEKLDYYRDYVKRGNVKWIRSAEDLRGAY